MNREIGKKWIKALRSGKYEQGQGTLRNGNSYCCLGVLTDLYCQETGKQWEQNKAIQRKNNSSYFFHTERGELENLVLPEEVARWAGMGSCNGSYSNHCLAEMNDGGKTFREIASIIQRHMDKL